MKKLIRLLVNMVIDLRFGGTFLGGTIKTKYANYGAKDTANTDYAALKWIFQNVKIHRDDVLVDVGCGKGRVLNWWLLKNLGAKYYGIELDESVSAFTRERLKKYQKVKILSGDATDLLPIDGTLFYLFNPFNQELLAKFKKQLVQIFTNRTITVVYYNPVHINIFEDDLEWKVRVIKSDITEIHPLAIIRPELPAVSRLP